ncbi:outer membrane beta-barrel protein [Helicobacter sp. 13S00477-4]|uniref:outer membrane beta-barrel protein n=1 Tax=Helicobacter sp. 13S00477-4 TaxID=1905759 RepID=UPI000BA6A77D|nr:outer membrane beta-barrel protein [Helicobacter sp. 13S00477-4]PAF50488.1 hypothetical protein BKH44_08005 [Helicobacter sp. 13S00477-4]PAF50493.1 hypothetical protein BKH44_08030 [Helicobacter sp. 13S00477-4]
MKSIKKALIITGCVISLSTSSVLAYDMSAKEKSGLFVGAEVGFSLGYGSFSDKEIDSKTSKTEVTTNMLYGAKLGYQQYFNAYNGLRVYGTFDYTNFTVAASDPVSNWDSFKYSADIDYLLNFSDSDSPWGFFVGAGYQWVQAKGLSDLKKASKGNSTGKVMDNGFVINAGFSKIISNHNRLELGVKVPLYNYVKAHATDTDADAVMDAVTRNAVDIYLSYSYSF